MAKVPSADMVEEDIRKAFSRIHKMGLKGHNMALGMMLERIMEKKATKRFEHDDKRVENLVDDFVNHLSRYEIYPEATRCQRLVEIKLSDEEMEFYKSSFTDFLLIKKTLLSLEELKKKHNIKDMKRLFNKSLTKLHEFLYKEQKEINAIMADFEGRTGFGLAGLKLTKTENHTLNYFNEYRAERIAFKKFKIIKKLGKETLPKEDITAIDNAFLEEINAVDKDLALKAVQMANIAEKLIKDENELRKAKEKIPPRGSKEIIGTEIDYHLIEFLIKLCHAYMQNIHLMLDQLQAMEKELLK